MEAMTRWNEALKAIAKFPTTNSRTTQIVLLSICDTPHSLDQIGLLSSSEQQTAYLKEA